MTAMQSRLLGVAILVGTVAIVTHVVKGSDPASASGPSREGPAGKEQTEIEAAQARARLERGAYVLSSKRLSDHEEIVQIVIPEGYVEDLDTRCVVYRDVELRTSTMTCSGIKFRSHARILIPVDRPECRDVASEVAWLTVPASRSSRLLRRPTAPMKVLGARAAD